MQAELHTRINRLQPSLIRKLANAGYGLEGLIPLWYGEPDRPTPDFIRQAAIETLNGGNTFYMPNAGMPTLRTEIAAYMNRLYGIGPKFEMEHISVTASGTAALMLAGQMTVGPGDAILTHVPAWPNLPMIQELLGAEVLEAPLTPAEAGWQLDLDRLFATITPHTRAILINSPSNPTGWTLDDAGQHRILEVCRQLGLWLIADEVYNRIFFDRPYAPTFADKVTEEDRYMIINSFSKSWAMTGWRLGWITAPKGVIRQIEALTEFNFSCVPAMTQQAGIAALREGEPFVAESQARYKENRDLLLERFAALERVTCPPPAAAFYTFFKVDGVSDSFTFAEQLRDEVRVGLAPGSAFGSAGQGWLRLCFAVEPTLLEEALDRMAGALR